MLVWIYGAVTLASLWALAIWTVVTVHRPFASDYRGWRWDAPFYIALGNSTGCAGILGLCGIRTATMLQGHDIGWQDVVVAGALMLLLLISHSAMIYASSLNHTAYRWRLFLGTLALWTLTVIALPQQ